MISYVKDSKCPVESLKEQSVPPDKTIICFDVSSLFTSISLPVPLEIINRKFKDNIDERGLEHF